MSLPSDGPAIEQIRVANPGFLHFAPQYFCSVGNEESLDPSSKVKRKGRPVKRMNPNSEFGISDTDSISHSQEFQKRVCTFNPYNTFPTNLSKADAQNRMQPSADH